MISRGTLIALAPALMASAAEVGLAGSEWRPVEIAGEPVGGDVPAFLQFRLGDRATGTGGCNRFTGTFTSDPATGALAFGPLAATRRACLPSLMEVEVRFFDALTRVRGYARDHIDLVLTDAEGNVVMRMAQTDAD